MDDCLSEDDLAALADGSLDEGRLEVAEAHLALCPKCVRALEETVETLDGVSALVEQAVRDFDREAPLPSSASDRLVLTRGTRVGRYEILESIGAGGMGRVYAARDPTLGRKLALKLLHPTSTTADLEARLLREAKAMARLSHPEVIAIHDVGHYGEQLFIAMELVEGGTLRHWLGGSRRTWKEVLAVFLRAGRGLAQAHAAGIIHRDFKPDNVLVGRDGRVRVTDFGLARTQRGHEDAPESARPLVAFGEAPTLDASAARPADPPLTRTGALLGTPAYMAPEQHLGAPADVRSDIYSFCVSLYEGLLGRRPFVETTGPALYARKVAGPSVARSERGAVPDRIVRTVLVGLSPRPADRYASMEELLRALDRAQRAPRWPLALTAAVGIVAVGAIALGARGRARSGSQGGASGAALPLECTTNRACVEKHGGSPYVCRADHVCASVASEDCVPKFEPEDLEADDTVWLGAVLPTKGAGASDFGNMNLEAADFARREIARTTKSFTGSGAVQRLRRIALVACDDTGDAMRAAHHLVDDVGVPAVLGFRSGQEAIDLAGGFLTKEGVASIATLSSNPLITRVPQPATGPRLVWRATFTFDAVGEAIARFIEDVLEPRGKKDATRVTLVRDESPGAVSFGDKFFRQLRFNGKSALENGDAYAEVTFSAPSPEELARAVERIVATKPTFLVLQGNAAWTRQLVAKVEARSSAATTKPTYIWAIGSVGSLNPFIGRDVDRRRRVFAVNSVPNEPTNARFVIRYNEEREKHVTRLLNGGMTYDAFYLFAYSVYAQGSDPITGASLARGFARLVPPGRPIEVGPSDLFDGITTLAAGKSIDLAGAATGLDFDLTTGEPPADFALLCAGVRPDGTTADEDVPSGAVFRARTAHTEGTLHCP